MQNPNQFDRRNQKKLPQADIRRNQQMLRKIIHGNKERMNAGVRSDSDKAEVIMKDVMKFANDRAYNNRDKANKEVQKVLDYYK